LDGGADPSPEASIALYYACGRYANLQIVKLLVEAKACVNGFYEKYGKKCMALHSAAFTERTDIVKYLLKNRAYVNAKSEDGDVTALHMATCLVTKILLKAKADVNCKSGWGCPGFSGITPLWYAVRQRRPTKMKLLLDSKADVGELDSDGYTLLERLRSCIPSDHSPFADRNPHLIEFLELKTREKKAAGIFSRDVPQLHALLPEMQEACKFAQEGEEVLKGHSDRPPHLPVFFGGFFAGGASRYCECSTCRLYM